MAEEEKYRLTDEEVQAQVMTFLAAGHETTSVALTWLRQELVENIPDRYSEPSTEYITSTTSYLDAVCKESMRLVPPAPITNRITVEEDILEGYRIPKGTVVIISPAVNHWLEEYWGPDSREFKPERWLTTEKEASSTQDETDSSKPFGAYMPFLLGPRNCIGQRFAVLEMKAILAVLVRGFEFVKVEGQVVKKQLRLTWKPDPGLQMRVKKVLV
ncbi:cytochrome P450 [Obelidium mucronatum]|nr:cytochrome P450 [Obelidium mucronatum]